MITQKELKIIKENKGKALGTGPKGNLEFILLKEGEKGIKEIEKALEKLGYSFKFREIKELSWYPEEFNLILLALIKNIFNWPDKKIREMASFEAKISLVSKIMLKYFISPKRVLDIVGNYWRKYHTEGDLLVEEFNEKERLGILTLKNFPGLPTHCRYLEGYFWQIASYVLPKENLKVKEIECPFQGGKNHRFKISW